MKKGIYRAVDVKEVVVEKLNVVLAGRVGHVAVDAAKKTQYAAIRPEGEEVIDIVKWEQPSEMGEFLELLSSLDAGAVEVILEPTGTYADPVRYQVRKAGHAVFRVSTNRVSDAASVYDGVASCHDPKAAWVIGRLHQQALTKEWEEEDIQSRQLRAAIKTKAMFDDAEHRALCRLEAELARYWPELTSLLKLT